MKYIKWLGKALRPHWMSISCMMVCHVLLAVCSVAFVYASKKLVDVAVAMFGGSGAEDGLYLWAAVMVGVILVRVSLNALRTYLQVKTDIAIKNRIRYNLFNVLLHYRNDGGKRHHSGDVLNRMQEDVRQVASILSGAIPNLFGTILQFVAAFGFLVYLDVRLALVVVIIVPLGLVVGKFVTLRIRRLTLDIRKSDSKVQSHIQESFQHLSLLQTFEYEGTSSETLGGLQQNLYGNELRRARFSILSRVVISLAFSAGHAVAFFWGVWGISTGTVTYGMMTAFLQLVGQVQKPLVDLSSQIPALIHSTASIDRIMELEALPREEQRSPVLLRGPVGVRLDNVTFSYPDSDKNVLSDFSYDFRPGTRTAIVGPTGVGKSTIIRLLLSLLQPQKGDVLLYDAPEAGQTDRALPASPSTRCNLIYVPQGNTLFSGTIRENLLVGCPDAPESSLWDALWAAAADFVKDMPLGLDTQCFEAGAGLSEGQAQRIAIARAILRPGSVLLLDEFSSALDAETETILLERLTAELPGFTMIFITHRERIIDYCDSVLRLG